MSDPILVDVTDTQRWLRKLNSTNPASGRQITESGEIINMADAAAVIGRQGARVLERFDSITGWAYIPGFGDAADTVEVVTGVVGNALKFTKVHTDGGNLAFFKSFDGGPVDFTPYIGGQVTFFCKPDFVDTADIKDIRVFLASDADFGSGFRGISLSGIAVRARDGKLESVTMDIPESFSENDGPDLESIVGIGINISTQNNGDVGAVIFDHMTISKPSTTKVVGDTARYTQPTIALVGEHAINSEDSQQRTILKGLGITNNVAAAIFIQIFAVGEVDAVTPGSTIPDYVIKVAASEHVNVAFPNWESGSGFVFFPSTSATGASAPGTPPDLFPLYDLT